MLIEGPLRKWVNYISGWDTRYFQLDAENGQLHYFLTKEDVALGKKKDTINLNQAIIGVEDIDESQFHIIAQKKKLFLEAYSNPDGKAWVKALEDVIQNHQNRSINFPSKQAQQSFDLKLAESQDYTTLLTTQFTSFKAAFQSYSAARANGDLKFSTSCLKQIDHADRRIEEMIDSLNGAIALLQSDQPGGMSAIDETVRRASLSGPEDFDDFALGSGEEFDEGLYDDPGVNNNCGRLCGKAGSPIPTAQTATCDEPPTHINNVPVMLGDAVPSSSGTLFETPHNACKELTSRSSENDVFFDAEAGQEDSAVNPDPPISFKGAPAKPTGPPPIPSLPASPEYIEGASGMKIAPPAWFPPQCYEAIDNMYDAPEQTSQNNPGMIRYLLSQLKIGTDLTKVVLPTYILEKRSLLEMFADFLAHPDLFLAIGTFSTPEARLVATVRWYLSAFHAGRKRQTAKKPYNPILGETFECSFDISDRGAPKTSGTSNTPPPANAYTLQPDRTPSYDKGPAPWAFQDSLNVISEQVSHHPPISAFYAESASSSISIDGHIWTKSKFLGFHVAIELVGQAMINDLTHQEEYTITFPTVYIKNIFMTPWIELGGTCYVFCQQTGYSAQIKFVTTGIFGGQRNCVTADLFRPPKKFVPDSWRKGSTTPGPLFMSIDGRWDDVMRVTKVDSTESSFAAGDPFVDTVKLPMIGKIVRPISVQGDFESRRLWQQVTQGLSQNRVEEATTHKQMLEKRQREEAAQRKLDGSVWEPKHFREIGDHYAFRHPLVERYNTAPV